jgi:hypothetical protein
MRRQFNSILLLLSLFMIFADRLFGRFNHRVHAVPVVVRISDGIVGGNAGI